MNGLPELPRVRERRAAVDLAGFDLHVQRNTFVGQPRIPDDRPDSILVSVGGVSHDGAHALGGFTTYLTPAMVVHIANTMLADEERRFIHAPRDEYAHEMLSEQLSDACEAINAMISMLPPCVGACAGHGLDVRFMPVLVRGQGTTWTKCWMPYCETCRESLSALSGAHNFAADILPDSESPAWAVDDALVTATTGAAQ